MSGNQHVIFWDFDGTLARREDLWSGALLDAWRATDPACTATVQQLRPYLQAKFPWHTPDIVRPAQSASQWWAALHPVFLAAYRANALDPVLTEAAAARVPTEFFRTDAWSIIDGAEEALSLTHDAGFRNIVVSNHAPELPQLITALGLDKHIESTITSAEVGAEKPNPIIFKFALEHAEVDDLNGVWMIGDNPIADIQGASQIGIRAVLADGASPNSTGLTVLEAAQHVVKNQRHIV